MMLFTTLLAQKEIKMSPTASIPESKPVTSTGTTWGTLVGAAVATRRTFDHALNIGLDPALLLRYANGSCEEADRGFIQTLLGRSPWAMRAVTGLVKAARDPKSHAAQILRTTRSSDLTCASDKALCREIEEAIRV